MHTTLPEIIRELARTDRRLTLFDPPPGLVADLRERLAERRVTVESLPAGAGPDGYAVLSGDGAVLATVDVRGLGPPFDDVDDVLGRLFDELDPLTFSGSDPDVLAATTREFEDRAWRAGAGRLHAGLRHPAALRAEADVYSHLGRSSLDVHVYVHASGDGPTVDDVTVHAVDREEIRHTGFVAFDGGTRRADRCALLVDHRGETPTGVWTYDPDAVGRIVGHLGRRYPLAH
jgi:hypothetical protein